LGLEHFVECDIAKEIRRLIWNISEYTGSIKETAYVLSMHDDRSQNLRERSTTKD
jgi:hypothetical protein